MTVYDAKWRLCNFKDLLVFLISAVNIPRNPLIASLTPLIFSITITNVFCHRHYRQKTSLLIYYPYHEFLTTSTRICERQAAFDPVNTIFA